MKTKIFILLTILAVLILSSCEQDQSAIQPEDAIQLTDEAPEGIQKYDAPEDEQLFEKKTEELVEQSPDSFLIQPDRENAGQAKSRTGYFQLTLPDYYHTNTLQCGDYVHGTTRYKGNHFTDEFYRYFGFNSNLNGEDVLYYLYIDEESIVSIDLTDTYHNLAMLLFKGRFDCNYGRCDLKFEEVIDWSNSSSPYEDHLGPKRLQPGYYLLIVDGRPYYPSDYKLNVRCYPVDNCYGYGNSLLNDDFESYYPGNISPQAWHWQKWNPYAYYDGEVKTNGFHQFMKVERKNGAPDYDQPDVLLRLGERRYGHYQLSFDMWIYRYKSGYFNIQKQLTYNNQHNEFGGQVYFEWDGTGYVQINGRKIHFYYPQDKWMDIKLDVNFYTNRTTLYIDGHAVAYWTCTEYSHGSYGSSQLEAVNFYPYAHSSEFFIDNVCFVEL